MVLTRSAAAPAAGTAAAASNKGSTITPAHQKRAADQGKGQHAAYSGVAGSIKCINKSSKTARSSKGSSRAFTLSVHYTSWKDLHAVLLPWHQSHGEVLVVHVQNELQQQEVQYAVYEFQEEHGAGVQQDVINKDGSRAVRILKEKACIMAALMALRAHDLPQDIMEHVLDDVQDFWMCAFVDLEHVLGCEECPGCGEIRLLAEGLAGEMLYSDCAEEQAECWDDCCCCCCCGCGSYPVSDSEYNSDLNSDYSFPG